MGNILHKIRLASLYVMAAFPVLMPHWLSLAAIFFVLSTLVIVISDGDYAFEVRKFLIIALPFFVFVLGLPFSQHMGLGLDVVQKKLLLLVLPCMLAFRSQCISSKLRGRLFLVFGISAVAVALYTNLMIRFSGMMAPDMASTDFTYLYRESVSYYSGLHPTYYSAILFWAAFLGITGLARDWQKKKDTKIVWLELAAVAIQLGAGLAAASRAPMIAFVLILLAWIFMKCRNAGKTWLSLVIAAGLVLAIFAVPSSRNRLLEINSHNMDAPVAGNDNGTNVRSGIYRCNIELLKAHWALGLGTGNVQPALNECFESYHTAVYEKHDYNTHNEYLNAWLTAGVSGIALLLASLLLSGWQAWRKKHFTHIFFLVFMGICFFTENYLERVAGVMLFTWFQCLFFYTEKESERHMDASAE